MAEILPWVMEEVAASGAEIEHRHMRFEERVYPREEMDRTVVARKPARGDLGTHPLNQ
jgi:hypothetical protein